VIKARVNTNNGPMVLLGLSGENITRLVAGEPNHVDLAVLGLPATQIAITYGKTERHIAAEWEQNGLLPFGTASDLPEPKSS
jgi:hypothetical protein